jgi:hypothetical protein
VDLEREGNAESVGASVTFDFESVVDGRQIFANLDVVPGRETYTAEAPGCADGCRFTGISIGIVRGDRIALTIRSMRGVSPSEQVVPPADLVTRKHWLGSSPSVVVTSFGQGLRIQADPSPFDSRQMAVTALDAALPVPVVATRGTSDQGTIAGLDGNPVKARITRPATMLPRMGADGVLVDLEYLQRVSIVGTPRQDAQVWIGADAPRDAIDRLRFAGLFVRDSNDATKARQALERKGPALALQFHLAAAAFGVALALGGLWLVAAVDRRRRADDLRALRQQGLARRFVGRAALWGYLSMVVLAALAGIGAAAVAWSVAGDRLPLFTDTFAALPPPAWPEPGTVLTPWAAAAAAMIVVSLVAAWSLRRAVGSPARNGRE